jgi:hypothetical protein
METNPRILPQGFLTPQGRAPRRTPWKFLNEFRKRGFKKALTTLFPLGYIFD